MPMFPNLNPRAYCQRCHVLIPEGEEVIAEREEGQHWKVWHVGMCPAEQESHRLQIIIAESLEIIALAVSRG